MPATRLQWFALASRLLAIVALAVQVAAASVVPWGNLPGAGIDRLVAASICHSDGDGIGDGRAPASHHGPDCAACPLCQAVSHAGVVLGAQAFALTAPAAATAPVAHLPPARAPPARFAGTASARGPPTLS
jgi:hypothetical protein